MSDKIIEFLIQLGVGSIIGIIIGMLFQYYISKKLKIFETKLVLFRRLYKYLFMTTLMSNQQVKALLKNDGVELNRNLRQVLGGRDFEKLNETLSEVLYYTEGKLQNKIGDFIFKLREDPCIINKVEMGDINEMMKKLKKLIR